MDQNEGRKPRLKEDVFASCQTGLKINRGSVAKICNSTRTASLFLETHKTVDDSSSVEIAARAGTLRIETDSRRVVTVPSFFH